VSLLPSLVAAIAVTWLARVAFVTLLPADRLPEAIKAGLVAAAPAVLGALTVVTLLQARVAAASRTTHLVPLAVAAFLAHRRANLAVIVVAAITVATCLRLLGW
jgi:branched-subunit amino acid transport protein